MNLFKRHRWAVGVRRVWCSAFSATLLLPFAAELRAARSEANPPAAGPGIALTQDQGESGLAEMLRRLGTTARLLQTVAHPDDEDGGMLTLESRGKGVTTTLLTLNRGEGGQNKLGSNLFDVLGVLRTLELTAADRYYAVDQRFTRVADFGFSKTPAETLQKWQGGDAALADMVRVIRTSRPDVIAARFSGTERDGHGHHQVSAILSREAFRAAADPARFPEQIKEGLLPWQAKKLYIGNVCGFGALTCPDADYTLKLNTGVLDSTLGMSYVAFAMKGLKHQLSQGAGAWTIDPGDRFTYYKLVDSVPPIFARGGHEADFFESIDTTLPGLAARLGPDEAKVTHLRPELIHLQALVAEAAHGSQNAVEPLLYGLALTRKLHSQVSASVLPKAKKLDLLDALETKQKQFAEAANRAAGVELSVAVDVPVGTSAGVAFMAVPGQTFRVNSRFTSRISVDHVEVKLNVPPGWTLEKIPGDGGPEEKTFEVSVPADAKFTRPYWHRNDPEKDAINTIDDAAYLTLPFPPPPVTAQVTYVALGREGQVDAPVEVKYRGESGQEVERPLAVAPAYSVMLEPGQQVMAAGAGRTSKVTVAVNSNLNSFGRGTLKLKAPPGWRVEPETMQVDLPARGEIKTFDFTVVAAGSHEGDANLYALLECQGRSYGEGYSVVTRDDLDTFYYYQPAVQRVSVVDVKIPQNLRVGYVMGAGDDIPAVLQQLGMDVTLIAPEKLDTEDLSRYGTIVLGIRAYDTQKDVTSGNRRLLEFAKSGGTLVVQYNTGVADFNAGKFTPYPAQLGRDRVSVEDAPMTVLAPDDPVFHFPNEILPQDFDGWVQERGLYFMSQWDPRFTPLLQAHDPGEADQKGGLLKAPYGKGMYIYTGYAFFRQLPAGVPGALRLYVNLLSAKGSG